MLYRTLAVWRTTNKYWDWSTEAAPLRRDDSFYLAATLLLLVVTMMRRPALISSMKDQTITSYHSVSERQNWHRHRHSARPHRGLISWLGAVQVFFPSLNLNLASDVENRKISAYDEFTTSEIRESFLSFIRLFLSTVTDHRQVKNS